MIELSGGDNETASRSTVHHLGAAADLGPDLAKALFESTAIVQPGADLNVLNTGISGWVCDNGLDNSASDDPEVIASRLESKRDFYSSPLSRTLHASAGAYFVEWSLVSTTVAGRLIDPALLNRCRPRFKFSAAR
jgi:hypothetical protein